ncbi:MAG: SHOCT domain-containing protein [Candidatus Nanopelagicales bacterium]
MLSSLIATTEIPDPTTDVPLPADEAIVGGLGIMAVLFVLFGIFFLLVVGFIVFSASRRYRAAKAAGLDPYAGDIQLMGQAKNSAMLAPERSVADRLAEVDALRAAGTISAEEHDAARARILGTV